VMDSLKGRRLSVAFVAELWIHLAQS
jgi:hypothetical protein